MRIGYARVSTDDQNWARQCRLNLDPPMPEELRNRAADNWRPLLSIADACSPAWGKSAREGFRRRFNIGRVLSCLGGTLALLTSKTRQRDNTNVATVRSASVGLWASARPRWKVVRAL
jgi:hypothetical protein